MRVRTRLLTVAGSSWPVAIWLRRRCRSSGVEVRRVAGAMELRRGNRAILLASKHAFFAPEVAENFDFYADALPVKESEGVRTADFAKDLETFNQCRRCLRAGVRIEDRGSEIWLHKDDRVMILRREHLLYVTDMAEKFDLYFEPLVPEEREGKRVLDYSKPGHLQTYRKSGLQFEMASFPEEEDAIEQYFRWYRPKAGDLVFDMGAHCGVSTYYLAKLVGPEGRVVAFEPDPINFAILERNLERHGLTNVVAQRVAIAGEAGQMQFSSEGTIGSSLMAVLGRDSVGSVVSVEAVTLAGAFQQWGVPALCKIDIEGSETEVLKQAGEMLRASRTNFVLDTHHFKPGGETTTKEVEAVLRSNGYEVASEANPLWTTWARPVASGG